MSQPLAIQSEILIRARDIMRELVDRVMEGQPNPLLARPKTKHERAMDRRSDKETQELEDAAFESLLRPDNG